MTPSEIGSSARAGFSTIQYAFGQAISRTSVSTKRFARPLPFVASPISMLSIFVLVPPIQTRKAISPPASVHVGLPEQQLLVYFPVLLIYPSLASFLQFQ